MSAIDWPTGWARTPPAEREPNRNFEVSLSKAFDDLEHELDMLDVEDYRYSFDAQQRQRDGRPYARARPDDPGFVLRWRMDESQYAVACDHYSRLRDNVRTIGHYLHEKRKMEQRPVVTGESEFANARLPAGDEETVVATAPPHEILEVAPDASDSVVKAAYRQKMKSAHPDQGGDQSAMQRVTNARDAMLGGESA